MTKTPTFLPIFLRTEFNYDMAAASAESGLKCEDKSLAQQNAKDDSDINVIMERFGRGQMLPEDFRPPQYGDFTAATDYHTAMNAVAKANEAFDAMPAKLRARFNNDPQQLMAFLDDKENAPEALKLGLLVPPPPPPPEKPAPASPEASLP